MKDMVSIGNVMDKSKDQIIGKIKSEMKRVGEKIKSGGGFKKIFDTRAIFFRITTEGKILSTHPEYSGYRGIEYYIGKEFYNDITGTRIFTSLPSLKKLREKHPEKAEYFYKDYYTEIECEEIYEVGIKQKWNTKKYNLKQSSNTKEAEDNFKTKHNIVEKEKSLGEITKEDFRMAQANDKSEVSLLDQFQEMDFRPLTGKE